MEIIININDSITEEEVVAIYKANEWSSAEKPKEGEAKKEEPKKEAAAKADAKADEKKPEAKKDAPAAEPAAEAPKKEAAKEAPKAAMQLSQMDTSNVIVMRIGDDAIEYAGLNDDMDSVRGESMDYVEFDPSD